VLKHCDDFVADAVRKFFSQSLPMGQWDVGRLEDILSFKQANNKSNLLVFYVENFAGEGFFAHTFFTFKYLINGLPANKTIQKEITKLKKALK